jgi:hypothetical protein
MRLLVKVEESDIRFGVQYNNEMNPPANGLRRCLAAGWDCLVTETEIILYQGTGTRHRFHAPAEVMRRLMEFDETGACAPFEFLFVADLGIQASRAIQMDLLPT